MSKFVVYVHVEPFVKQWLIHSYGNPVVFPPQSVENSTIRRFSRKQPDDVPIFRADDVAIAVPDSKAKAASVYNYLGLHGQRAVRECIEDNFKLCMWRELNDLSDVGCTIMTAIYSWCEMHGISIDYADTIRQRYYRLRNSYVERGVDMRKSKRSVE